MAEGVVDLDIHPLSRVPKAKAAKARRLVAGELYDSEQQRAVVLEVGRQ